MPSLRYKALPVGQGKRYIVMDAMESKIVSYEDNLFEARLTAATLEWASFYEEIVFKAEEQDLAEEIVYGTLGFELPPDIDEDLFDSQLERAMGLIPAALRLVADRLEHKAFGLAYQAELETQVEAV